MSLERAKLRASAAHYERGRRLAANIRFEEALLEYQLAAELNPTNADVERELTATRNALRAKVAVAKEGRTALEALIDRTRDMSPAGLDLPEDVKLADSLVFGDASARAVFTAIARFADINSSSIPAFRDSTISIDLRNVSLGDALATVLREHRTFYRVTAPRTITIVPDTPAKRREYEEEVVRTFYLSNADLKETIDLLESSSTPARSPRLPARTRSPIKDTPERIAAVVSRAWPRSTRRGPKSSSTSSCWRSTARELQEYGLQIASPGQPGISGSVDINRARHDALRPAQPHAVGRVPRRPAALFYRLLKNDTNTRALASPRLRTSEGLAAQARFGERVPVPVTTFAPIATGGINQQPITSFVYENIGVNIDITPRIHHDDEVSLVLRVEISNISGTGFGGLPTFGNRQITTTIRLRDGETNMLAGLIRDNERTVMDGHPGPERSADRRSPVRAQPQGNAADRHPADAHAAHHPRAGSDRGRPASVPGGRDVGLSAARSAGAHRAAAGARDQPPRDQPEPRACRRHRPADPGRRLPSKPIPIP